MMRSVGGREILKVMYNRGFAINQGDSYPSCSRERRREGVQVFLRVPNSFHPLAFLPSFPVPFSPQLRENKHEEGVYVSARLSERQEKIRRGGISAIFTLRRERSSFLLRDSYSKRPQLISSANCSIQFKKVGF